MTKQIQSNDAFIALIRVAQDEPNIRSQLEVILKLNQHDRKPLLATFCDQMTLQQKPQDFITAVTCLNDDKIAAQILKLLHPEKRRISKVLVVAKWVVSALIGGSTLLSLGAILILCVDPFMINIPGLAKCITLAVCFISGIVLGIMSLVQVSWFWINVCLIIYAIIGLLIVGNMSFCVK